MILSLPLESFISAIQSLGTKMVFHSSTPATDGTYSLCCFSEPLGWIQTHVQSLDEPTATLREKDILVLEGHVTEEFKPITDSALMAKPGENYFVAVSYHSKGETPGVWADVFPFHPSEMQVIRAMFDEFRITGEVRDVSIEEFVRLGKPNVVIITPEEATKFLEAHLTAARD